MPEKDEYPRDLWTARRAEYVTMVKKMPQREKKGCRDITILMLAGLIGGGLWLISLFS